MLSDIFRPLPNLGKNTRVEINTHLPSELKKNTQASETNPKSIELGFLVSPKTQAEINTLLFLENTKTQLRSGEKKTPTAGAHSASSDWLSQVLLSEEKKTCRWL